MRIFKKIILMLGILTILLASSITTSFAAEVKGTTLTSGFVLSPGEKNAAVIFIQNDDTVAHSYALSAGSTSNSYEMYFSSNGVSVNSIDIPAATSLPIDFNITLTGSAVVSQEKLTVKVARDDGKQNTIDFTALVNKDYAMSLRSMVDKTTILSGKSADFTFSVTNNGTKKLTSVQIAAELPYKWVVSQGADQKLNLQPGETGTLKLTIDVPGSQVSGNFVAKFTASGAESKSEMSNVPITVKTGSNIGYWMIGILILIAGLTFLQFKRHGRR